MKTKIIEMRQKRAKLIADARSLLDAAEAEKRDLSQEEQNNWDAMMDQADQLRGQAERLERQAASESDLGDSGTPGNRPGTDERSAALTFEFRSRGMRSVAGATVDLSQRREWRHLARTTTPQYLANYRAFLAGDAVSEETRALQADLDTDGGYLVAPLQLVDMLIKEIDDQVFIRQLATVVPLPNADSLGIPTLESDPADADWTTELATGNEDSSMKFGRRELKPNPLAKRLKISRKLLMKVPGAENLAMQRLGYKFGISQEKGFLLGSGAGEPLGIFTAHADGIPTSRDVSEDNTTTNVTADGLINTKYNLKQAYWARARWIGHRDFYKRVAKLKDGEGQYIWRESVRVGEPDRLLNLPTAMSEYAPNTFTTGQYVGALGDVSTYWIADSMMMEMQRLIELYAETNQIGLIGRLDCDGQPTLGEAFSRVKLA